MAILLLIFEFLLILEVPGGAEQECRMAASATRSIPVDMVFECFIKLWTFQKGPPVPGTAVGGQAAISAF